MQTRPMRIITLAMLLALPVVSVSESRALLPEPEKRSSNAPLRPLQGIVLGALDAVRLKEGGVFRVRVSAEWQDEDCRLKPGEIIQGHVVGVQKPSKTEKTSQFQVTFTAASCAELRPQPMSLTLVALVGADLIPEEDVQNRLNQAPPLADVPGVSTATKYAQAAQANPLTAHSPSAIRDAATEETVNGFKQFVSQTKSLPRNMSPEQVINAPRISLKIGAGQEAATVVACSRGDTRIESGSTLILVATDRLHLHENDVATPQVHTADSSAPTKSNSAGQADPVDRTVAIQRVPPKPVTEPQVENEVCSTACVTLSALESRNAGASKSGASLPLKSLGYAPRQAGWATRFNHETTLTYLDEHRLLLTFDPHRLRMRNAESPEPARNIRAVLIDPATLKVQRVLEWQVRGDDSYLWRYGSGMVLVRMGSELHLMNRDLQTVKTVPLEGTVEWVVSSPSMDHTAVGLSAPETTAHEVRGSEKAPLQVKLYDRNLELISESTREPGLYPPVLSDRGEVRLEHAGAGKWEILEYSWDRREETLATVHSTCRPLFSAEDDGLTFVTGCTSMDDNVWYRMLDAKGHTLLKAASFSDEMAHRADAEGTGTFAIRTVRASPHSPSLEPFRRSDLLKEHIDVFRNADGKRVGSVTTDDFVLSDSSFALSPGGDQMAVVGKEAILFYKMGKEHD